MMVMKMVIIFVEVFEQKVLKDDKEDQGGLILCLRVHQRDQICF